MKVALLLEFIDDYSIVSEYDYLIGVDRGALKAIKNNVKLDLAIGDFDSITEDEYEWLKDKVTLKCLNPIKDETDTKEAIAYAYSLSDDVTILGGIMGRRCEHFIANLTLFSNYPNLKIVDDNSLIFLKKESFILEKGPYYYVSFFAKETVIDLTLKGFKYELTNYLLKPFDALCISNNIKTLGSVTFAKGELLVILTKEDSV